MKKLPLYDPEVGKKITETCKENLKQMSEEIYSNDKEYLLSFKDIILNKREFEYEGETVKVIELSTWFSHDKAYLFYDIKLSNDKHIKFKFNSMLLTTLFVDDKMRVLNWRFE